MSRVGLTVQERQLPRGTANTAKIDMTPEQRAEWCQQVAIKLVEDAIGGKYELRGTESVGPKIGDELMQSGILAPCSPPWPPSPSMSGSASNGSSASAP